MTSAARSLTVFGAYVVLAGLGLALVPGVVLGLLGSPPAADNWVRVVGLLAVCIGIYHVLAARHEVLPYIRATVPVRVAFAAALATLVALRFMPTPVLLFAVVDLLGAGWTWLALRSARAGVAAPAV